MPNQLALPGLEPEPPPLTRNQQHPAGGRIPGWIEAQLEENKISSTRVARFHRCHRCQQIVITGLDAATAGIRATVDPTPLTSILEYALATIDRSTYHANPIADGFRLDWRFPPSRIPETDTAPAIGFVLPAHHCGRRLPGFIAGPEPEPPDPDQLPF